MGAPFFGRVSICLCCLEVTFLSSVFLNHSGLNRALYLAVLHCVFMSPLRQASKLSPDLFSSRALCALGLKPLPPSSAAERNQPFRTGVPPANPRLRGYGPNPSGICQRAAVHAHFLRTFCSKHSSASLPFEAAASSSKTRLSRPN